MGGQAVRAIVRWVGSGDPAPKACPDESNTYTDTDDLVFAIAPAHSACYDFTTHKCICTAELCDKEKCGAAGMIWTQTCVPTESTPNPCTCDDFGLSAPLAPLGMPAETECAGYSEGRCVAAADVGCVWNNGVCT